MNELVTCPKNVLSFAEKVLHCDLANEVIFKNFTNRLWRSSSKVRERTV